MIPNAVAKTAQLPAVESNPQAGNQRSLDFKAALGWVYNTYNSNAVSMAQYSVLAKASMDYSLPSFSEYSLQLSSYLTALPLNESRVLVNGVLNDVTIRFFGANFSARYEPTVFKGSWKLGLHLGWYFNTTFVTQNLFGYEAVTGPQLFPTISYRFENQSSLGAYFKWSPMMKDVSFMRISENYEIAAGLNWIFPFHLLGMNQYLMQFDFAHLAVKPNQIRVISNSSSFSFGALFH